MYLFSGALIFFFCYLPLKTGSNLRDRAATVLIYLEDTPHGGETVFPDLGVRVAPKQGRALIFNSMDMATGRCLPHSVHKAMPVGGGAGQDDHLSSKTILQRWYYFERFDNLGRRPREPETPPRRPGQGKVACDGVGGYCRLYDEWGPEHIIEYRRQMGI